ncbi:MAG: UDP-N-acetylmuramoyl-L-alanine--D-glutamate ligase [Burkholderiales bacterium]|nr:UDP-N-acetylmuramoyl-L-alanine--D-glutamate ligase [Burkholderiales bacterium]
MIDYKKQFKGKKITIMGLGLLGRGLGYTKFFAECGADLIVTDLKTKEQIESSVKVLSKYKNIKFVLGEHRLEDFKNRDLIMKAAGVPIDSIYIKEAVKNNIPIEMDVSLFAKSAPEVMLIGATGTRGKSMTTALIYEILKQNEKFLKRNVFIGGNVRGVATLPLLKKVKEGDILVCELDSWQLQGFGDSKLSPHISVFTSFMPDHMNYYGNSMERYFDDKANIFKFQKENDILIIREGMKDFIKKGDTKGKLIIVDAKDVDKYNFIVPGKYQKENLACAVKVAEQFNIPISKIAKAIKNFKGLEGRLQYIKTIKGVKIYNDNNATTPEATMAGIEALSVKVSPNPGFGEEKRVILICGGADKKLPLEDFVKVVNKYCKGIIMIPGTGTDELNNKFKLKNSLLVKDLNEAVKEAIKQSKKGDIILFSPAFASFGQFNNEYERNDLFLKIIKKLK